MICVGFDSDIATADREVPFGGHSSVKNLRDRFGGGVGGSAESVHYGHLRCIETMKDAGFGARQLLRSAKIRIDFGLIGGARASAQRVGKFNELRGEVWRTPCTILGMGRRAGGKGDDESE